MILWLNTNSWLEENKVLIVRNDPIEGIDTAYCHPSRYDLLKDQFEVTVAEQIFREIEEATAIENVKKFFKGWM